ncbi:MAG: FAD-linked oxidase C-terminal domain-containing protein [Chloroflexota bacterium]
MRRHADGSDPETADLVEELRRAGVAEADGSSRRRAEYSSDASLYRVTPAVVAFPRSIDELEAIASVARERGAPMTARGAGTSIAGNAIGPGIVIDTRRHLRRIHHLDREAHTATVEPGVVLDDLQREASLVGLRFGPDPSTHDRCTLGGMIGNNACGSRALGYGRTVDNVRELEVVTGNGTRFVAGAAAAGEWLSEVRSALALADEQAALLRSELDRFPRQVSGYGLHHLLPEHGRNVARALVGSEGTCALTLLATVDLVPLPAAEILVVFGYVDMAAAADAVPALLGHSAVAIEGMDARITETVRQRRGADAVPALPRGGGWLLVELAGETVGELESRVPALLADADTLDHRVVVDQAEVRAIWGIREAGAGLVARASVTPAHAGWEDAAVPPEHLGAYLRDFEALLAAHGLHGVPYGHFGDGCLHVRIDFPFHAAGGSETFRTFLDDAADLVAGYGGSISGEHGDGRARSGLLPRMFSPEMIGTFARFKQSFDGLGILNPGVLVDPAAPDADLRFADRPRRTAGLGFRYDEDDGDVVTAVHRCTGVGRCTVDDPSAGRVMCPSYLATRDERDSTRGRARVLQEMIDGTDVARRWDAPEVHESLDLCLSCKGCGSDCPTGVDMAPYKAEALYQTYRGRPRPLAHYSLGQFPRWVRAAARLPGGVRRAATRGPLARVVKVIGGIDQRRQVPVLAPRTFRAWLDGRDESEESRHRDGVDGRAEALLWVDTFTNHFRPEVAVAAVEVLEDAGYDVRVPSDDRYCGLTWITTGQLDTARRSVRSVVEQLAAELEVASRGTIVVGLEPSCTTVLREDARRLLGGAVRRGGRGEDTHAGRGARSASSGLDASPDRRHACRGPAALPPPRRDGMGGRPSPARGLRCDGGRGRRLLRAGRGLRRAPRLLRHLARHRRDHPVAAGDPGRRRWGARAGRRLLVPHAGGGPRRRPFGASRRTPRRGHPWSRRTEHW